MLPALLKIKKRNGLQSDITVIGNCEGDPIMIVKYQIIIPFLDSPAFCFNILSAIFLQQGAGPACLFQPAMLVQFSKRCRCVTS
jgi:hypothetical protein